MRISTKLIAIALTALAATAYAQPTTFLGPTAHVGIVQPINDESAFALAAEAGPKNLRGSGTIGWEFDFHHRIKASAEYLRQKLTFDFFDGQQNEWVGQGAVGANYQYDFREVDPFNTLLDLSAYYAYSPSNNLGTTTTSVTTPTATGSTTTTTTIYKRLAGARAYGFGSGINLVSLYGTSLGLEANYDNVHYFNKNSPAYTVSGMGGTLHLAQALTDDVTLSGSAAVRKPFNNYEANIGFGNIDYYGVWMFNAFGGYTVGKHNLPSSYNVGLGADYLIDASTHMQPPPMRKPTPRHYKDYKDYKDMPPLVWQESCSQDPALLKWVSVPAVRMPQVLKVPDQKRVTTTSVCVAPILVSPIPDQDTFPPPPGVVTIDVAPNFTGSNLTFSISVLNFSGDATISISGSVITIQNNGGGINDDITVTAANGCGSISTTFHAED